MGVEQTAAWGVFLLQVYTAWARSGRYAPWHLPLWVLTGLVLVLFLAGILRRGRVCAAGLACDPFLYAGALFLLLLGVQWFNQAGDTYVHILTKEFIFTPPPRAGWPFSIDPQLSKEPLAWFAPAWLMVLCVRHLFSRPTCKALLWGLLGNAVLLAGVGVVQYALGWSKMYGLIEVSGKNHFISCFAYPNHGGAFFYLLFAVAIGLALDAREKKKAWYRWGSAGLAAVLFAAGALCSLSRAAVLAVVIIALCVPALHLLKVRRLTPTHYIHTALAVSVVAVALSLSILRIGNGAILREFRGRAVVEDDVAGYAESRGWQVATALAMVREFPLFGVGGWGYRTFVNKYLPAGQWGRLGLGKANVHCDPVQFMAEHGLVGFGLMSVALGALLWPWRLFRRWRYKGLAAMAALGAALVFVHSLIDLPFRCPTVLWHWLLLLAVIPKLARLPQAGASRNREPGRPERVPAAQPPLLERYRKEEL